MVPSGQPSVTPSLIPSAAPSSIPSAAPPQTPTALSCTLNESFAAPEEEVPSLQQDNESLDVSNRFLIAGMVGLFALVTDGFVYQYRTNRVEEQEAEES
jgi:hypothetical protein